MRNIKHIGVENGFRIIECDVEVIDFITGRHSVERRTVGVSAFSDIEPIATGWIEEVKYSKEHQTPKIPIK